MIETRKKSICYIDTNVFISAFEKPPEQSESLKELFEEFKKKPNAAVTSELTLAELLVMPIAPQSMPASIKKRLYMNLLIWSKAIDLRPITRTILYKSADLPRIAGAKHSLPDAIHIATAMDANCLFFMSDDSRLKTLPKPIMFLRPDPSGIATVLDALRA